jgi:tape measure domain-containing protein
MATERFEEVLRFIIKTSGSAELRTLAQEILDLGVAGEGAGEKVGELVDELAKAERAKQTVRTYAEVRRELQQTRTQLEEARKGFQIVSQALAETENPSKAFVAGIERSRKAIAQLEEVERKQAAQVKALRAELNAAGVDLRTLGSSQAQLAARVRTAEAALRGVAEQSRAARAEQERLGLRSQATADSLRQQSTASRTARDALQSYRERARQAAQDTGALRTEASATASVLGRLRGVLAPILGFLSIRTAVEGAKNILGLGDAAEGTRKQLEALYGSRSAANQALEDLRALSRENALAFNDVLDAARRLKSFGIEPLDGSLQKLIDINAKLGGGQERLQGIILALGQAWAKQKLQGEEILQLVERGVPVYDLLAKATGRNVSELQKLQVQGKLGRDVIRSLIDEIGKAGEGAAAANVDRLSSRWGALVDRVQQFFTKVSQRGALQFFKDEIAALTARIDEFAANGQLDEWAQRISNGIVSVATTLRDGVAAIIRYKDEILLLAQAYATVKVAGFVSQVLGSITALRAATIATGSLTAATAGATKGAAALGARLLAIPRLLKVTLLAVGFDLVLNQAIRLNEELGNLREAGRLQEEAAAAAASTQADLVRRIAAAKEIYARAADQAILSSEELAKSSQQEAEAYLFRLQQATRYFRALAAEAKVAGDAAGMQAAREKLAQLAIAIQQAKDRVTAAAAEIARGINVIGEFGEKAAATFDELRAKGDSARKAVDGLFKGIELTTDTGLAKVVDILTAVSARGTEAGRAIRAELREQVKKLSDEDFPKFLDAARKAFAGSEQSARDLDRVIAEISLEKLGVDVGKIRDGFTAAGRAAVDAFRNAVAQVKDLGLTAKQEAAVVREAFEKALAAATTKAEVEALKRTLREAFDAGKIGAGQFALAIQDATEKLLEIGPAAGKAFAQVGDAAFDAQVKIVQAMRAARGEAASEAEKLARQLAEALESGAGADVTGALRSGIKEAEATIQSLNGRIDEAEGKLAAYGQAGKDAGQQVADGAAQATDALASAGDAAQQMGSDIQAGADQAEESMASAGAGIAALLQAMNERFAAESENARQLFVFYQRLATTGSRSVASVVQGIYDAAERTQQAIDTQRQAADAMIARFDALAESGNFAGIHTAEGFEHAERQMQAFTASVREGRGEMRILSQETLDKVAASIERANQKLREQKQLLLEAKSQLADLNASLQDELDQMAGNLEAQEKRKFQQRLQEIRELAAQGGAAAAEEAAQAERRARELHEAAMKRIREQRAAEAEAERQRREESTRRRSEQQQEASASGSSAQSGAGSGSSLLDRGPSDASSFFGGMRLVRVQFQAGNEEPVELFGTEPNVAGVLELLRRGQSTSNIPRG